MSKPNKPNTNIAPLLIMLFLLIIGLFSGLAWLLITGAGK